MSRNLGLLNLSLSKKDGEPIDVRLAPSLESHDRGQSVSAFSWDGDEVPSNLDEVLSIHEYERQRLGQELHDSAGQLLVSLQLSVAHLRIVEGESGHGELFDQIQETLTEINQQIRSLAFLHYPVELADRGLSAAVESLARGFGQRTGIDTSFKVEGDLARIDEPSARALLRIAQEALVNVHRHSHASSATVLLRKRVKSAELIVSDDGVGIPEEMPTRPGGIGLKGMRDRVEKLGGCFKVTNLERGAEIYASVPLAA
jgi:two-component system NarL family sensor kinase